MQMFMSVSGPSSEISIANHSSRPTVSQLKCVSDAGIITNWFENHHPQKTKISTVIYAPFIQNSNQMVRNHKFSEGIFQLLQFSRQRPSFSAHRAALMTKTDLIFPAFSSRFADFAVQFCFRCKFSFHEKRCPSQVWHWRDFSRPITILASHSNQWNCFMKYSIYEIIHIWNAVVDESEEWSSQLIFQFKQLKRRSLKKSGLQWDSNPWPPRYRCDALPTELWSHTLGARSIYWVHFSREENCDDHSSLSSTTAVQIWIISYILYIMSLRTGEMDSINWPRSQRVAS